MYLISKGSLQDFQKYIFHGNRTNLPEVTIFFSISVVKMTNFDPRTRNCHVIHQIEANEPGIIIKLILAENFYPESKYIRQLEF